VVVETPTDIVDELSNMVAEPPSEVVDTTVEETVVENPAVEASDTQSVQVEENSQENGDSSHQG
jgi:hypothetical protein